VGARGEKKRVGVEGGIIIEYKVGTGVLARGLASGGREGGVKMG
jgi:hypothetical protein